MKFYLGTPTVAWLARSEVPLFVSRRRLAQLRRWPRARACWALDSGAFSELAQHGRWTVPARQYADEVRAYRDAIGRLAWAACQDWMCEPHILDRTGLTVPEHQRRTLDNYLDLRGLAPEVPWVPVLQGWTYSDYLAHADLYAGAGIDLAALPLVGLGSVCRRQSTRLAEELARELSARGIRLHGFGFKTDGLLRAGRWFASADSMAWSFAARRRKLRLAGCSHTTCANCPLWALRWRDQVLTAVARGAGRPLQGSLFPPSGA